MSYNMTGAGFGGNLCFTASGLTAGTTTTSTIANDTTYSVGGQLYKKTAASNATTPTVDATTGAAFKPIVKDQACIFVYSLNAAGDIKVSQGPIVTLSEVTGGTAAVHFPGIPDSLTAIGYLYAQGGSTLSGTWTFGTNNLSSVTGMTYTFRELARIPGQPITA